MKLRFGVAVRHDSLYRGPQLLNAADATLKGKRQNHRRFHLRCFYDRWSRLLARYVPKYLPGTGDGRCKTCRSRWADSANSYVRRGQADGLTIGMMSYGMYLTRWSGAGVQYDVRKFKWIGFSGKE